MPRLLLPLVPGGSYQRYMALKDDPAFQYVVPCALVWPMHRDPPYTHVPRRATVLARYRTIRVCAQCCAMFTARDREILDASNATARAQRDRDVRSAAMAAARRLALAHGTRPPTQVAVEQVGTKAFRQAEAEFKTAVQSLELKAEHRVARGQEAAPPVSTAKVTLHSTMTVAQRQRAKAARASLRDRAAAEAASGTTPRRPSTARRHRASSPGGRRRGAAALSPSPLPPASTPFSAAGSRDTSPRSHHQRHGRGHRRPRTAGPRTRRQHQHQHQHQHGGDDGGSGSGTAGQRGVPASRSPRRNRRSAAARMEGVAMVDVTGSDSSYSDAGSDSDGHSEPRTDDLSPDSRRLGLPAFTMPLPDEPFRFASSLSVDTPSAASARRAGPTSPVDAHTRTHARVEGENGAGSSGSGSGSGGGSSSDGDGHGATGGDTATDAQRGVATHRQRRQRRSLRLKQRSGRGGDAAPKGRHPQPPQHPSGNGSSHPARARPQTARLRTPRRASRRPHTARGRVEVFAAGGRGGSRSRSPPRATQALATVGEPPVSAAQHVAEAVAVYSAAALPVSVTQPATTNAGFFVPRRQRAAARRRQRVSNAQRELGWARSRATGGAGAASGSGTATDGGGAGARGAGPHSGKSTTPGDGIDRTPSEREVARQREREYQAACRAASMRGEPVPARPPSPIVRPRGDAGTHTTTSGTTSGTPYQRTAAAGAAQNARRRRRKGAAPPSRPAAGEVAMGTQLPTWTRRRRNTVSRRRGGGRREVTAATTATGGRRANSNAPAVVVPADFIRPLRETRPNMAGGATAPQTRRELRDQQGVTPPSCVLVCAVWLCVCVCCGAA